MNHFYLATYRPLAVSKVGRQAAIKYSLPPFVDGSIRREPDLLHEYPAITSLRGTHKFALKLRVDDVVGLMLKRGKYGMGYEHQRMTALLRVIDVRDTHVEGATWYRKKRLRLPNNCMVPRNKAFPISRSHQKGPKLNDGRCRANSDQWDEDCNQRATRWGTFVICERLFINLDWDAPEVSQQMLIEAFGKVPGTLNPKKRSVKAGQRLIENIGLSVRF